MTITIIPLSGNEIVAQIFPQPTSEATKKLKQLGGYSSIDGIWNFPSDVTKSQIENAVN